MANVLRAGRSWVDDGHYQLSRGPGAAIHELATAVLDRVGGSVAINLVGVAFALLALWSVRQLLRADRSRWPTLATLVLAASPWFWLASTSLGDFTWALALGLAGAVAARRDRRVLAGVLFALGIGCRAPTAAAGRRVAAVGRADRGAVGTAAVAGDGATGGFTVVTGVACFIPPWLDAGRSFAFLHNQLVFAGWGVQLGRWAVKNAATATVPAGIVLVVGVRHLWDAAALAPVGDGALRRGRPRR